MDLSPIRIYVDTSVFGGVFEQVFEAGSVAFFNQVKSGLMKVVTSVVVKDEIVDAPLHVIEFYEEIAAISEVIDVTPQVERIVETYLNNNIVTRKYYSDALHVALATASNCDAIVSWNLKHIVQMDRIRMYNAINLLLGYNQLAIHTPVEVLRYEI